MSARAAAARAEARSGAWERTRSRDHTSMANTVVALTDSDRAAISAHVVVQVRRLPEPQNRLDHPGRRHRGWDVMHPQDAGTIENTDGPGRDRGWRPVGFEQASRLADE